MADSTIWVAAFAGGTAVLSSWVTSLGNARAARVQAQASARAQVDNQVREARRAAYLAMIEQAHLIGELYWRLGDVYVHISDPGDRLAQIDRLRADLRDAYDPLMRCARVIALEGPAKVADAADAIRQGAMQANNAMARISEGKERAREGFDAADRAFRLRVDAFIETAQAAMAGM